MKTISMIMVVMVCLSIQLACRHALPTATGSGSGDGDNRARTYERQRIIDVRGGRCPVDYPYCATAEAVRGINDALDDLDACESHLARCQADLDAIPDNVQVVVEQVVRYRTPWYVWMILGGVVACVPVGIGLGYHFGGRR